MLQVQQIQLTKEKETLYLVHYQGWNKKYVFTDSFTPMWNSCEQIGLWYIHFSERGDFKLQFTPLI